MNDKLWVFGGVKEEDFYSDVYYAEDYQSALEHYDYVVEETGNGKKTKTLWPVQCIILNTVLVKSNWVIHKTRGQLRGRGFSQMTIL